MSKLTVLANDPSITAWGWAVIQDDKVVASGCIKTGSEQKARRIRKGDDTVRRVSEINEALLGVIREWDVNYVVSELPHGSQSASAAVMIGVCTGIMQTIADCLNLAVEWYSEADAKKAVTGRRSVGKQEMIDIIAGMYEIHWHKVKYKDEAVADAMAVYHVAKKQSSVLRFHN